jgi:ADP-ribose pyrophosphatase
MRPPIRNCSSRACRGPVFRGHFLDVRRDLVRLPDGATAAREYIVHPGAVMIVPLLPDGRLVVERQYRYPMGRVMLEFPAGKIDASEPPFACAVRELAEETGYRAREWARAGILHNAIAYSNKASRSGSRAASSAVRSISTQASSSRS